MNDQSRLVEDLKTLNQISETLNRSVDVHSALADSLWRLLELMGLDAGWIFLLDEAAADRWWGRGYVLAAHHSLPPALALDNPAAWDGGCDCQGFCNTGKLTEAYNEVRCTRLEESGDRSGLKVHASAPLRSGDRTLGILNVAAPDWESFSEGSLALLTNVGAQMGVALERARLFDLMQESRVLEQSALLAFSRQLLGRLELADLIHFLVREVAKLVRVDACAILLSRKGQEGVRFAAWTGWHSDPAEDDDPMAARDITAGPFTIPGVPGSHEGPELPDRLRALLANEGFQASALVPLVVEALPIGVLMVNSRRVRVFTHDELRLLQLMANQGAIAIEKARLHQEEAQRQRLEEELAVGRQIQMSMLPKSCPVIPGWQFRDVYLAARQVGGDFYDFFQLPDEPHRLGMVIGDVSDKGVPAALFMGISRTLLRRAAFGGLSPAQALQEANVHILRESHSDLFLSAHYAILNTRTGRLDYANAGHNPPLHYRAASHDVQALYSDGILLCILEEIELEDRHTNVAPGDLLVFYTDGLTEAVNPQLEEFGLDRLNEVILANTDGNAGQVLEAIIAEVASFAAGADPFDDLTMFVVKRL